MPSCSTSTPSTTGLLAISLLVSSALKASILVSLFTGPVQTICFFSVHALAQLLKESAETADEVNKTTQETATADEVKDSKAEDEKTSDDTKGDDDSKTN